MMFPDNQRLPWRPYIPGEVRFKIDDLLYGTKELVTVDGVSGVATSGGLIGTGGVQKIVAGQLLQSLGVGAVVTSGLTAGAAAARGAELDAAYTEQRAADERRRNEREAADYKRRQLKLIPERRARIAGSGLAAEGFFGREGEALIIDRIEEEAEEIRQFGASEFSLSSTAADITRKKGAASRTASLYGAAGKSLIGGAGIFG